MEITCISASNVEKARQNSASTRVCHIIRDLILERSGSAAGVQIAPLLDYELQPCRMCGDCFDLGHCARDDAFNQLYRQLIAADGVYVVCPHYAPFPSKMMIVLEKLEEMFYLRYCADPSYESPRNRSWR